jgi:hypothetical protein
MMKISAPSSFLSFGFILRATGAFFASLLAAQAFPPAPHYSIYGDVRDEYGYLISPSGASVVFYLNSVEIARYPITGVAGHDYTYEIKMRIDMKRAGTAVYNSRAVDSGSTYSLAVDMAGVLFYPIRVASSPTVGAPAERRRLDITLGGDSDGDGLPDAWEELQLYNAGLPTTDLSLITRDGDFDGDGISNFMEYLVGTSASDPAEGLYLSIKDITPELSTVEFFAITSKVYSIEKSTDLAAWSPVNFSVASGVSAPAYTATGVGAVTATIPRVTGEAKTFYRLHVR